MTEKKIHAKPSLYAFYFYRLKEIAMEYGYNLVLHGSMNRDLDLIAIPWAEEIKPFKPMIEQFAEVLGGSIMEKSEESREAFRKKFNGRDCWVINLNRAWALSPDGEDPQYYIDISIIPSCPFP